MAAKARKDARLVWVVYEMKHTPGAAEAPLRFSLVSSHRSRAAAEQAARRNWDVRVDTLEAFQANVEGRAMRCHCLSCNENAQWSDRCRDCEAAGCSRKGGPCKAGQLEGCIKCDNEGSHDGEHVYTE